MKKDISSDEIRQIMIDLGIQVRKASLCGRCRAVTRKHADGYLVLIEERLSFDTMLESLKHELRHIILGHLDNDVMTVDEMESEVTIFTCINIIDRGECLKKIYSVS